jgi:hypothetical protein
MSQPAPLPKRSVVVAPETVEATIAAFTRLDASGDKRSMGKMAQRLGKEQPAMLRYAAEAREAHGAPAGEATVFYGTLVWAMFDRQFGTAPRLLPENLGAAEQIVNAAIAAEPGAAERAIHERTAAELVARQPHLYARLCELIAEDLREAAVTSETAAVMFPAAQIIIEAFDAALEGRRPGERIGPVVRDAAKVGRNDPCPCGSGQKYKKCHGLG